MAAAVSRAPCWLTSNAPSSFPLTMLKKKGGPLWEESLSVTTSCSTLDPTGLFSCKGEEDHAAVNKTPCKLSRIGRLQKTDIAASFGRRRGERGWWCWEEAEGDWWGRGTGGEGVCRETGRGEEEWEGLRGARRKRRAEGRLRTKLLRLS